MFLFVCCLQCFVPTIDFGKKWSAIQILFLIMGLGVLVVVHFWGMFCSCSFKNSSAWQHTGKLINTGFMLFSLLFLYLLRMQLDVVNCSTTEPNDGKLCTDFTSVTCGGLCECWEEDGLQMKLLPWTVLSFAVYSVGFFFYLYSVLKTNWITITNDQHFRCLGYGE